MHISPRFLISGALARILKRPPSSRPGAVDPAYCYGVGIRHLAMAQKCGMAGVPKVVAELGVGRSLGAGLVFLLAGSEHLIALDERDFLERDRLLAMFDGLVELFRAGARPNTADNFPSFEPPKLLLTERVGELRADLERFVTTGHSRFITYLAPWQTGELPRADFLFSHAVLQQVRNLDKTWRDIAAIMSPGGYTTHQFDMTSFGTSKVWNGHWAYPEWAWKLGLAEEKGLYLNRQPFSGHVEHAKRHARVVWAAGVELDGGLKPSQLAKRWRSLNENDARTHGGFVVATPDESR